jgi:hypothetical protein
METPASSQRIHPVGADKVGKLSRVHHPPVSLRLGWLQIVLDERALFTDNIKSFVDL